MQSDTWFIFCVFFLIFPITLMLTCVTGLQTLAAGFLTIANGLMNTKRRADYRHRLLSLCSDVSLASESKTGG